MLSNIFLSTFNYLINNDFIIKIRSKNLKKDIVNFNFTNISFENLSLSKKIFFSKNNLIFNEYNEASLEYHSFNWLNLAKQIGGSESVIISRNHIYNWQKKSYIFSSFVWNNEIIAKRLINLIYYYEFFALSANKKEKNKFLQLIAKNYFVLNFMVASKKTVDDQSIEIQKSLLLFKLIFNFDSKKIINLIRQHIKKNVNKDGIHISMNPCYHAEYINNLYEIKNILLFFNKKLPDEIEFQILNMTSSLIKFFHKNNSIALFNGSNNANFNKIKKICSLSKDIKAKNLENINDGIAIYENNIYKILFDVAKPSVKLISQHLHAGTLSFELSSGKEKIFTNCGSIEKRGVRKLDYLRFSAAHSTIVLNNTNISELGERKSYKRVPQNVLFNYSKNDDFLIWNGTHDGYKKNFQKLISRKLFISKSDFRIIGEDSIISTKISEKNVLFDIRFHLTTECKASLTRGKNSVLIVTKLNNSFIFESESNLSLNESVYVYDGKKIEKTIQIVISGFTNSFKKTIKWEIKKL